MSCDCQYPTLETCSIITHGISFLIFSWVDTRGGCTHCHGCILVFSADKLVPNLTVMHALDDLWPDKRALGNDALERDHVVQMLGAQRSWITRKLAKGANERTVVHNAFVEFVSRPVRQRLDDIL